MRRTHLHVLVGHALLSALVAGVVQAETTGCSDASPLTKQVRDFEARDGSIMAALVRLGSANSLCIALDFLSTEMMEPPINVKHTRATAGQVIEDIVSPIKDVEITSQKGVILIRNRRIPDIPWLRYRVREFTRVPGPIQAVSFGLFMQMKLEEDPSITGYAGTIRPGDFEDVVGPFQGTGKTVRELLNQIVVSSRAGAMWMAHETLPEEFFVARSLQPYWTVLGFTEPISVNQQVAAIVLSQLRKRP